MLRGTGGHGKPASVGKSRSIDRPDTRMAEIMAIGTIDSTSTGVTNGATTGMIDDTSSGTTAGMIDGTTTRTTDGSSPGTNTGTIVGMTTTGMIDGAINGVIEEKADDNKMCSLENGG